MGLRGCLGGREPRSYRVRGVRGQLEGGAGLAATCPRSAAVREQVRVGGGRRHGAGWAGPSGPSPQASYCVFPFCFVCCLCYFFLVINLLTLAFL